MTDLSAKLPNGTNKSNFSLPKIDWIWVLIFISPLVWWALARAGFVLHDHHHVAQVVSLPHFVGDSLLHIAPYFVFAITLGAYAVASDASELVNRAFRYNQPIAIALAALAGTFSPLCSCGVIPLIAALLVARVPVAPIMAFWLASPLMAPEQFVITQAALSLPFATAKGTFALLIGLAGGYLTYVAAQRIDLSPEKVLRAGLMPKSCCGSSAPSNQNSQETQVVWAIWSDTARLKRFWSSLWETALFLGKWMILAFVLEALMLQLDVVAPLVGWISQTGIFAVPLSALIGIPAYLNGDAAPFLVSTFVDEGLGQGAAMAFLIGGGVTCIPAAVAVWSLVRPAVFALYLSLGMSGAVLAGFAASVIL